MPLRRAANLAAALAILILAGFNGTARAQVGDRNFYDPLITYDANPSNELTLEPGWARTNSGSSAAFSFSLEKMITNNVSIFIGESLSDTSRRRVQGATGGFDNLEVLLKWAYYMNIEHELRLAVGLDTFAPVGDINAGAGGHWRGGPMLLLSKGAGDIPKEGFLRYLRPFELQMDAAYLPRWTGSQLDITEFDAAISYELYYLALSDVHFPGESFLHPLVFYTEFNYQQVPWAAANASTPPDWRATPGAAYLTDYYEVEIGTQLGLNRTAVPATHANILFEIDIYYDQIWPQLGPLF